MPEPRYVELIDDKTFLLYDFFTPAECAECIAETEKLGYVPAAIGSGNVVAKDYRDNLRVIVDDKPLAQKLFERTLPFLPKKMMGRRPVGFNERLRYYKYNAGHVFQPHKDGGFIRGNGEMSFQTVLVYLNDGFEGGTTDFYNEDGSPRLTVVPVQGMALIFKHELTHGGAAVVSGTKYVLRSDVMFGV